MKTICTTAALFCLLLAPSARYSVVPVAAAAQSVPKAKFASETAILESGQRLSLEYGSQPPYSGPVFAKDEALSPDQAAEVIPYLGACESRWKVIKEVDSNGFYSYGPLQMQSSTVHCSIP